MTQHDVEEVLAVLEQVVAEEGPDFKYPDRPRSEGIAGVNCYYVWEGKADCIAGRVLHRLSVPLETLTLSEGKGVGEMPGIDDILTSDAREALTRAQEIQDEKYTWGEALEYAKDVTKHPEGEDDDERELNPDD